MKKKEKERLKTDPFVHFMQNALAFAKAHRRPLLAVAAAVVAALLLLLGALLLRNLSASGENALYAEAFRVRQDAALSLDQKIAALEGMKFRRGVSAAGRLFLASLHFEKGDLAKAGAALDAMPRSRVALLNDQKLALQARVLAAGGKTAEAEALLARLLAAKKPALARELVLLDLARLQSRAQRSSEAAATLQRILAEHPNTPAATEARTLLDTLEKAGG